jgi:dTDP-glucose pyrophosphorylase
MQLEGVLIHRSSSIRDAMQAIDRNRCGAVVVVDEQRRLVGIVTDGDVRRAVLAAVDLAASLDQLLDPWHRPLYPTPLSAPASLAMVDRAALMYRHKVRHLPIVDESGTVVDLSRLEDLIPPLVGISAVVMAGGLGTRLRPLTDHIPKPMLEIGGKPLLEHLVRHLSGVGVRRVQVTTHYKGKLIAQHFGDGREFGADINYVQEDEPLGTAGALSLLPPGDDLLLVINGDILTRVDIAALTAFHKDHRAEMTVGVKEYQTQVPYGVIEVDGVDIVRVIEKPTSRRFVNAGIYLLNPTVAGLVPCGRPFDMPDLINLLIQSGKRVISFPIREYWLDIGEMDSYLQAQADVIAGKF